MALDLADCQFEGPALPEPFVKFELEKELSRLRLLPKTTGTEGRQIRENWNVYRRKLRDLTNSGGPLRVQNHVIEPLVSLLGYNRLENAPAVQTREELEPGGVLLLGEDGAKLRAWATAFNEDLYAPSKRGRAYRFSHLRIAQRVLLATGERLGLLTNGIQLLLLISDPARPDSTVSISINPVWKRSRDVPDSFRFLLAIASPDGVKALPEIVDKARLHQSRVTKELRFQARRAIELFIQEILDHPDNRNWFANQTDREVLARALWREGLIVVYRLLFILKMEASDDPARSFSFASTSLWRNTFSPSIALASYARDVLERGAETGNLLESGLRVLFRMFEQGLECTELIVKPLGGALFGQDATPILSNLAWGERAVAWLLDQLLWTPKRRGVQTRERVHYGSLEIEDLGRVYEALLELEPGITSEAMCRLRRQKLEVVVPVAQGEKYRPARPIESDELTDADNLEMNDDEDEQDDDQPARGKKTKVEWVEEIPPNRFFLRVGLGRKASGSYYTPHSFVRFLVQETLGPQVAERSPQDNPRPLEILKLKVLDPAMGSGHFLVEACRFLGEKLYEACRLCDEKALAAERRAETAKTKEERAAAEAEAREWRQRIIDLPDPNDELLKYLPSRSPEREGSGLSQKRAEALCRRLVATHCLYGVDKNPLAVELAKLALWLESHAEGMPLTFLDHRLVVGDSLTGPFFDKLIFRPGNPEERIENLFHQALSAKFSSALQKAIQYVNDLEASVGITLADIENKRRIKAELDRALLPFRVAAAAWSGGVMLGPEECDDHAYTEMLQFIADTGDLPEQLSSDQLRKMIARGLDIDEIPIDRDILRHLLRSGCCVPALPYDLTFPEVFYPNGQLGGRQGFHVILGNPPWERMLPADKEFFASYEFAILDAPTKRERDDIKRRLLANPNIKPAYDGYISQFRDSERLLDVLYKFQVVEVNGERTIGKQDAFRVFMERNSQLLNRNGWTGVVVPSAFHANEGATGVRRLYLEKMALHCCYSFENRRKLFDIHSSFKFALVVAEAGRITEDFYCAFYLHDDEWLFTEKGSREPLRYTLDFVRRTGGDYLSLLELRSSRDLGAAQVCFAKGKSFGQVCERLAIQLGRELNMTDDSWRFTPTAEILPNSEDPRDPEVAKRLLNMGYLVLHEGKTFWHYDDHWGDRPLYCVHIEKLSDKPSWLRGSRYFRLAYRAIASSTNERTVVFNMLPPGCVFGNSAPVERTPQNTPRSFALQLLAQLNTFVFDWTARVRTAANINKFILLSCPLPMVGEQTRFFCHASLRLVANHAGYAPLWQEQLGNVWREPGKPPFTWPVLAGDDERWEVRAAIDAVVADAYGLSRDQYAHVLSTFSHTSYPRAPVLCLAKFDELKQIGLEAFTKKYDPYWDIPLNENLPQPVIDLPVSLEDKDQDAGNGLEEDQHGQLRLVFERGNNQ